MDSPDGVLLSLALTARIPFEFASQGIVIDFFTCEDSIWILQLGYCYRLLLMRGSPLDPPAAVLLSLVLTTEITLGFASRGIVIIFSCEDPAWIRQPGYCYHLL